MGSTEKSPRGLFSRWCQMLCVLAPCLFMCLYFAGPLPASVTRKVMVSGKYKSDGGKSWLSPLVNVSTADKSEETASTSSTASNTTKAKEQPITLVLYKTKSPLEGEQVNVPCPVPCHMIVSGDNFNDTLPVADGVVFPDHHWATKKKGDREFLLGIAKRYPKLLIGLMTPSEAPPCRWLDPDVCRMFHFKVALFQAKDVQYSTSMAPTAIPPIQSNWYNEPTFCQKPEDCIGSIKASVRLPSQLTWETGGSIQNDGYRFRGYWIWELAKNFTVVNYSGESWLRAHRKNATDIDHTKCYPAEQAYCDDKLLNGEKRISRSPAGPSMQFIGKILLGTTYKFTLEIENKEMNGYMTEKFYAGFLSRTLMVYCGPENAKEYAPGEHSYIDCHDFENPYQLAAHLKYLDKNHTAYLEYFEWKKKPLRPQFLELFDRSGLQQYDRMHDLSTFFLDTQAWTVELKKSLQNDPGWPMHTAERAKAFIETWASDEYKSNYKNFVQSRIASGKTWMCDICSQISADREGFAVHGEYIPWFGDRV